MAQFNFKEEFAPKVESRSKRQTIRKTRKKRPKIGEAAHLFTGQRTPECRKLGQGVITLVKDILIDDNGIKWMGNERYIGRAASRRIAKRDGFSSPAKLIDFFRSQYGLPFQGILVRWTFDQTPA